MAGVGAVGGEVHGGLGHSATQAHGFSAGVERDGLYLKGAMLGAPRTVGFSDDGADLTALGVPVNDAIIPHFGCVGKADFSVSFEDKTDFCAWFDI